MYIYIIILLAIFLFYFLLSKKEAKKSLGRKLNIGKTYEEVEYIESYEENLKKYSNEEIKNRLDIKYRKISSKYVCEKMRYIEIIPKDVKLENIPVLILLHGLRDSADDWIDKGKIIENYLELMETNEISPFIIILPDSGCDGESWYANFYNDEERKYQDYMVNELYNEIEERYGSLRVGIGGFSMGGNAAFNIGINHLDKFKVIGSFAGAISIIRMTFNSRIMRLLKLIYIPKFIFSKDKVDERHFIRVFSPWGWRILKYDPYTQVKNMDKERLYNKKLYISVGEEDKEPYRMVHQWADMIIRLKKHNIEFTGKLYEGEEHTWDYIAKDIKNFFKYFSKNI